MGTPQNALVHASTELAERHYNDEQIKLIRDVYAKGATEHEFRLFLEVAKRKGLDIFQRQIHLVKRWDSKASREVCEIQTGIDGYRLIADRTGRYEGQSGPFWCGDDGQWVDVWLHADPPRAAKVGIWRAGCREPFWGVALYSEYVQTYRDKQSQQVRPNPMWARMPANQLAKCAEALALRKAFPAEMSGIYTSEEMAQANNPAPIDVTPEHVAPALPADGPISQQQLEELQETIANLLELDVEYGKLVTGVNRLAGTDCQDLEEESLVALSSAGAAKVIASFTARLQQLAKEARRKPSDDDIQGAYRND